MRNIPGLLLLTFVTFFDFTTSHRSYIRSDCARELGYVPRGDVEVAHSLFGGVKSKAKKHDIFLIRLKDLDESYACNFSVLCRDIICDTIPCVKEESWVNELRERNIFLSDIGSKEKSIDVLIGTDVAGKLITGNKFDMNNGLIAFETLLGWTVMGKLPEQRKEKTETIAMFTTLFIQEADVSDLWSLDVLGITDPIQAEKDIIKNENTRNFVRETAKITSEGRYEVKLPWKDDHVPLPENYDVAQQRLKTTVEKLNKQGIASAYNDVFESWLTEKIIERVPENEISRVGHYLPHRPVIKMNSTTKIRPVFDASAKRKGNPSLNQCLKKGPNLIELVPSSLNRFREREIGVISDIKGSFLQIVVDPADREFLRFLWLVDGKIVVYRHCRVVFGLSCSPFLLAATIEMLLEAASEKAKESDKYLWTENSVKKLRESFYVDNCVTSVDSKEELEVFVREARAIMATGGFDLRGWESSGGVSQGEYVLVHGISWNKHKDTISINPTVVYIGTPIVITKRVILSAVHKIFDPIGFTCPVSLQPKIWLKQLWKEKVGWDTEINDKHRHEFLVRINDLPLLKQIEIPRKIGNGRLSIHTFGDASGLAYAAVVFARIYFGNFVGVQLLNAKSRISPEKASMPRLELMAASIAVRLTRSHHRCLQMSSLSVSVDLSQGAGDLDMLIPITEQILEIEWHFNPPSAPWWGGWWERLIGVLKTILRKILGKASLSYESLTTALCDVEAIINSRPLTYVSEDEEDLKPLTPAMFLQEIQEIGVPDFDMLYHENLDFLAFPRLALDACDDILALPRFANVYLGS
ncbi:uncharacterized protein LOC117169969 [Belonocnema kinseyi]|uniref:uncharacterized protein LOC117169969 n=1 Tax=Belonocnema kinseyi TaxID=2817044 RepID=UPI00143DAE6F|nr:uncharacterized protein LOC117169969 [Belonocnema kinseyi]